ncbi:amidase signature enzyme [Lipomyces japonicus]|uniref:amidase signature enzyme n=1 Tax=Lipomyces japonicus TaxID=56871 RepID=UPI0034CD6A57
MLGSRLIVFASFVLSALADRPSSTVAHLGDVAYYVPSKLELAHNFNVDQPLPVTVVTSTEITVTAAWLNTTLSSFLAKDDVYSEEFFASFYLQGPAGVHLADDASEWVQSVGSKALFIAENDCGDNLLDGPYFASCTGLHRAWRLYDDYTNSFLLPTIPSADDPNTYEPLDAGSGNPYGVLSVAVPSRLFYTPTPEQPLAGRRIGVKDEYDLKGTITTMGSRARAITYPPVNVSSGVLQNLLDQGAIIVGKTKLSMFADAYFTSAQWVDYSLPVNVRGDTYQIPGASSAGSGSSIIAYDWLDNTVGEDTGGSMRYPSALNGVFGIRSSLNSTNNTHTAFGPFDVAGHFARDVDSLNTFGAAMYSQSGFSNYTKFPSKILYPEEFWTAIADNYTAPCEEYVQHLEAFLGVNRTIVNTNKFWLEYSGQNVSIGTYFENTFNKVITPSEQASTFIADYEAKFDGSAPYETENGVDSSTNPSQNATVTAEGIAERKEFQAFYAKYFLGADSETCSDAIVVFPFNGNGGVPWYRDTVTSDSANGVAPSSPEYLSWNLISPINGSPEVVVPVGTVGYQSRVSLVEEEFPAALEIQAAHGCDFMLLNLVREVAYDQNLPKAVKTGRYVF